MTREEELATLIIKHKQLYYRGNPEISDHEYDHLEEELKKINPNHYVLSMVGALSKSSEKIKHDRKMLSLEKTYSLDGLKEFMGHEPLVSTFKLDGMSCSLVYENGNLVQAKTRGDGVEGENIFEKVKWIETIPKVISNKNKCEVRGELYTTEQNFYQLSELMEKKGLARPTSMRNIVAGLMGRKENLELCQSLCFMAFDYLTEEKDKFHLEHQKYLELKGLSFEIPEFRIHTKSESLEEVIEEAAEFMSQGHYQIDGLVFTYEKLSLHEELGETAHHPRYKIAFKFLGESKKTKIINIEWSVSRNGVLTPVGVVEPVELSGAMISRVTLHNYGLVKQHQLKAQDTIEIVRSGEVIPKFLSVVESSHSEFTIPDICPSCQTKIEQVDIRLFCINKKCPAKNKEIILNFVQKIGIEDLSEKRIYELMNAGLVSEISDLYKLNEDDFKKLEKVKDKLSTKLVENIQKSKVTTLEVFLSSLGIEGGAFNKCQKLTRNGFDTIDKILSLEIDDLLKIESFAEKSSEDFIQSLKERKPLIHDLLKLGFEFVKDEKIETKITGLKICITGALSQKRSDIEDRIRICGGVVVSSVSKNTDVLVTNEVDPQSSKYKKAMELKVKIINEQELMQLMDKH